MTNVDIKLSAGELISVVFAYDRASRIKQYFASQHNHLLLFLIGRANFSSQIISSFTYYCNAGREH